jgi:LSD1 subclass zinc finger protein
MDWIRDDQASFGEMIARHALADCRAPLVLTLGDTLIAIRCSSCHRLVEHHSIWPEDFAAA